MNLRFHGCVGTVKATEMKDPPSFSRLVDLRPVEPSRGPSLVKVNTNSRQCVSRSYPYFPLSLAQPIYIYVYLSLSLPFTSRLKVHLLFSSRSFDCPRLFIHHLFLLTSNKRHDRPPLLSTGSTSFRFLAFRPSEELFLLP